MEGRRLSAGAWRVETSIPGGGDSAVPAVTPGAPAGTIAEPTGETPVPAAGCRVPERPGGPAATRAGGARGESVPYRYPGYPAGPQRRCAHRGGMPRSPVDTALDRREAIPVVARPGSSDPWITATDTGRSDSSVATCPGTGWPDGVTVRARHPRAVATLRDPCPAGASFPCHRFPAIAPDSHRTAFDRSVPTCKAAVAACEMSANRFAATKRTASRTAAPKNTITGRRIHGRRTNRRIFAKQTGRIRLRTGEAERGWTYTETPRVERWGERAETLEIVSR